MIKQNKTLKTDAKKLYWEMRKQLIKIKEPPAIKEVEKFQKKNLEQ